MLLTRARGRMDICCRFLTLVRRSCFLWDQPRRWLWLKTIVGHKLCNHSLTLMQPSHWSLCSISKHFVHSKRSKCEIAHRITEIAYWTLRSLWGRCSEHLGTTLDRFWSHPGHKFEVSWDHFGGDVRSTLELLWTVFGFTLDINSKFLFFIPCFVQVTVGELLLAFRSRHKETRVVDILQ